MHPSQLQERALSTPGGFGPLLEAVPDLELWLRGRTLAIHGDVEAAQLWAMRSVCADLWPLEDALVEADAAISIAALSTALLDTLGRYVRVGGAVVVLDRYTMSMSKRRLDELVAPTALEIVRFTVPHFLPVLSRGRKPVSCILRRRN